MLCTAGHVFPFCNFRAPDPDTQDAAIPVEDLPQYVWATLFGGCLFMLCASQSFIYCSCRFGRTFHREEMCGTLPQKIESKVTGASGKECVGEVTVVLKASHVCVLEHQDETCPDSWGL